MYIYLWRRIKLINSEEIMKKELVLFYCKLIISGKMVGFKGHHFMVGKTTQPLDNRFRQTYEGKYSQMFVIYRSSNLQLIDWLEKELIIHYIKHNQRTCDNNQLGGGYSQEETAAPNAAIYLVIE